MENIFFLSRKRACQWWSRPDLEPKPENMERVAEVLRRAEIEVYSINYSWLVCEPRPDGIYEALSGKTRNKKQEKSHGFKTEEPSQVLEILVDKGTLMAAT